MTLPHEFKRIWLNLARSKEFPSGSERHGYEFVAPLDAKGHIDPKLWQQHRVRCIEQSACGGSRGPYLEILPGIGGDLAITQMIGGFHGNDALAGLWVLLAEIFG